MLVAFLSPPCVNTGNKQKPAFLLVASIYDGSRKSSNAFCFADASKMEGPPSSLEEGLGSSKRQQESGGGKSHTPAFEHDESTQKKEEEDSDGANDHQ